MQLSVRQAATQAGVSRQTLFRYIKEGKISATLSHTGEKQIEITELLRVFGSLQPETVTLKTASDNLKLSQSDSATTSVVSYEIEIERLRSKLEVKTAELSLAQERIAELKTREHAAIEEKSRFLSLIEQQSRLLTMVSPQEAIVKKPKTTPKKQKATTKPKTGTGRIK